jgi:hypothetical protein
MEFSRREAFLGIPTVATAWQPLAPELKNQVGIVTSSLSLHVKELGKGGNIALLDLPRVVREELDLRVLDLASTTLPDLDTRRLERFRSASEKAGCAITNLKMNQTDLDMDSPDAETRRHALSEYKRSIDAAAHLGCRWARPLPRKERPNLAIHCASYRELSDHAESRKVRMLVENFGWMENDAEVIPSIIRTVARNIAASPDTGNWLDDRVRYAGLAKAFPLAVSCDFKAKTIDETGRHLEYDLKRCFLLGKSLGYHGPWCIEHANRDRKDLFDHIALVRDSLRRWLVEYA